MKKIKSCIIIIIINVCLLSLNPVLHGQIIGNEQVIIHTNATYIHSLSPAASGTAYAWEAEDGTIISEAWNSLVVNWETDGDYIISLFLVDLSDNSTELLGELPVSVVTPVINYEYDDAGNRISRSIVYYSNGIRKSKRSKMELEKKLEATDRTMVYPNPSDNVIYLKLSNEMDEAQNKQYILYDNLGKIIIRKDINTTLTEIDVSQLTDGAYYLVVFYDNNRKDWKIIKY